MLNRVFYENVINAALRAKDSTCSRLVSHRCNTTELSNEARSYLGEPNAADPVGLNSSHTNMVPK